MKIKHIPFFIIAYLSMVLCLSLTGCSPKKSPLNINGFYFDTVITITLYDYPNPERAEVILEKCLDMAEYYDLLLSRTNPESEIYLLNHSNGTPVTCSPDTIELLNYALHYANITNGLVDPTIGALSSLWNIGSDENPMIPADKDITNALSHIDYRNVVVNGSQVSLSDPDAMIDLGFIAKGYVADKMQKYLRSEGISSAIINLGGNIYALGSKQKNAPFAIGVQKPFSRTGETAFTIFVSDKSVVSSGNYERYFECNNEIYHHILSTKDGYPVNSGLSSVTIISDSSLDGDAFSTICFIMGTEKAEVFLSDYPDIQAFLIKDDGSYSWINAQ